MELGILLVVEWVWYYYKSTNYPQDALSFPIDKFPKKLFSEISIHVHIYVSKYFGFKKSVSDTTVERC